MPMRAQCRRGPNPGRLTEEKRLSRRPEGSGELFDMRTGHLLRRSTPNKPNAVPARTTALGSGTAPLGGLKEHPSAGKTGLAAPSETKKTQRDPIYLSS
jgi:hypothetical protein